MEDKTKMIERLKEVLSNLNDSDIINLWNRYCEENKYDDDVIYSNDEETINFIWDGASIIEVLQDFLDPSAKNYNIRDEYLSVNWNRIPTSFDNPREAPNFDADKLAEWAFDNVDFDDYFQADDIKYILNDYLYDFYDEDEED